MLQLPLDIQLDGTARLDNFYIGENRQILQRLTNLHLMSNDFIFIWGRSHVGKSHLAQAICRHYADNDLTAAYFPLSNKALFPEVLDGLEYSDLVCLDAFESIADNKDWQIAIFNLFNKLKHNNRQFVIFSEHSPNNISLELNDLKSRLNSMEVYKLVELNAQQQRDFVLSTAEHRGLEIPADVAQFILSRSSRGVDDLISIIDLLDTQSIAQQRKITVPFVKKVLNL